MLKEGMFIQGRYEIVGKIGTGGMADVYKAKDHKLNRFVAVKVLKPEFREEKAFTAKFKAEAQAAAGLAHPNIVNIYDVGEDRGVNFIVMELVEGITLKEYIGKKGKLAVREATSIAIQVSQGLEAAHNSGIIHRDVKPQNIIISTDGKVKVTDFGIARATSSNTISTTVMGSVHYSSPEQARGGYSDAKSDIYSLGITLYEMLTGRVPFDGDTTVSIAIKHLQEEMKSPDTFVPDLPRSTVQIINKCTQKSPDRRYGNMAALIRDLKESLVNPGGDFVHIPNISNDGRTVVISKEELGAIKEGYQQPYTEPPKQPAQVLKPGPGGYVNVPGGQPGPMGNGYNKNVGGGYDPYSYGMDSRAYGNRGYKYGEEPYDNDRNYDDEEDNGLLNPKLEKVMMVGSIIIAVLIACIFLGLIANALGIFKFSLPGIFGNRTNTETTKETMDQTGGSTTDGVTEQQAQQTNSSTTATEQTQGTEAVTQATESQTETESTTLATDALGEVPIPEVVGTDYDSAVNVMMEAGFYVERQDENDGDYAAGTVLRQSMTGTAKPSTSIILVVSTGVPEETQGAGTGTWRTDSQLDSPAGYNGEIARLELQQNGQTTVVTEGTPINFPYDVSTVNGAAGASAGEFVLSLYNEVTGVYDPYVSYTVTFYQVD